MAAAEVSAHIGREHYQVRLIAGNNAIIADEPDDIGGKNLGFSPYELLLASLGACTSATLRMYADKRDIKLDEVKVSLTFDRDNEQNITQIKRNIEFIGNLSDEDKERLLTIANKCPVHKVLTNPIHIETKIVQP